MRSGNTNATKAVGAVRTVGGALVALGCLCGCTSVKQSFPGHAPQQVWAAMVAVARTPNYESPDPGETWTVVTNEVWLDEPEARIEIFRRLFRSVPRPGTEPQSQQREWRFQIRFESSDPPAATFVSRGGSVPMHAHAEAERYFADVRSLLRVPAEYETTDLFDALGLDDSSEPLGLPETWRDDLAPTAGDSAEPATRPEHADEELEPLPPPPGF